MEMNTVCISTEEYNKLKKYKDDFEVLEKKGVIGHLYCKDMYIAVNTKVEKALKEYVKRVNHLDKQNRRLAWKNFQLTNRGLFARIFNKDV